MTRRVLLHVGAPKTGTSFVQDILFTHRDDAARARHPLPRRPPRRPLPRGARPDGAALGRARARGRRRLGPARRRGPRVARHRDHQPRDPRAPPRGCRWPGRWSRSGDATPRSTSSTRPATWSGRSRPSGRRTSSTGARRPTAVPGDLRDEQRSAEVAQWFWGVQEVPDVLDRWAESIPRERVHLVTVPPPGLEPDPAVGAVRRPVRDRPRRSSPPRTGPTPRSAYPSRR